MSEVPLYSHTSLRVANCLIDLPVQVMLSNGQVGRVRRLADQHTPPVNKASNPHTIPDPSFDGKPYSRTMPRVLWQS